MCILIVDDSEQFQEQIRLVCENRGYQTKIAEDGYIALSLLETVKPELVITDIDMPRVNGIQLINIASSMGYKCIAATGNDSLYDIAKIHISGAIGHVVKDSNLSNSIIKELDKFKNE